MSYRLLTDEGIMVDDDELHFESKEMIDIQGGGAVICSVFSAPCRESKNSGIGSGDGRLFELRGAGRTSDLIGDSALREAPKRQERLPALHDIKNEDSK